MRVESRDAHRFPNEARDGFPDTAEHWLAVYGEMLAFVDSLLEMKEEVGVDGRPRLEDQRRRLQDRIDFWRRELRATATDEL